MTTKRKVNSKNNVKRRRTSLNRQTRLRQSYSSKTSIVTVRGKEAGKGITKPSTFQKNNDRKSGKVITNRTSNKSFKRGTMKKVKQKLPMTAFMITPIIVIFKKLNPLSRYK